MTVASSVVHGDQHFAALRWQLAGATLRLLSLPGFDGRDGKPVWLFATAQGNSRRPDQTQKPIASSWRYNSMAVARWELHGGH